VFYFDTYVTLLHFGFADGPEVINPACLKAVFEGVVTINLIIMIMILYIIEFVLLAQFPEDGRV
jgi:hypothetical protein